MTVYAYTKARDHILAIQALSLSCLEHSSKMAEIAAGALVAEQAVTTTLEGGAIAGYAVAKPTVPLKATFSQIATADKDDTTYAYTTWLWKGPRLTVL